MGLRYVEKEISKEDYERYTKMSPKERSEAVEPTVPMDWRCGYGWYGCVPFAKEGKFFLIHTIGSSCD